MENRANLTQWLMQSEWTRHTGKMALISLWVIKFLWIVPFQTSDIQSEYIVCVSTSETLQALNYHICRSVLFFFVMDSCPLFVKYSPLTAESCWLLNKGQCIVITMGNRGDQIWGEKIPFQVQKTLNCPKLAALHRRDHELNPEVGISFTSCNVTVQFLHLLT